jgi:hypothetical protein
MKINEYWFKSKRFGWGFVPISWEGWLMVFILVGLMMLSGYLNNIFTEPVSIKDSFAFLFDVALIILASMPIHLKKSKDKPRWRWGK